MGCDAGETQLARHAQHFNPRTPVGCDFCSTRCRVRAYRKNFNPRTPVGCDKPIGRYLIRFLNFNPRTPVGCDKSRRGHRTGAYDFNPRTPVGCDPATPDRRTPTRNFNPRTPVGCDSRFFGDTRKTYGNFNPRTPVGCDVAISFTNLRLRISIHAPQWGATGQFFLFQLFKRFQSTHPSGVRHGVCTNGSKREPISIHAPQWGATKGIEGVDRCWIISIHAPQWGATIWDCDTPEFGYHFNPRTPVGCDDLLVRAVASAK